MTSEQRAGLERLARWGLAVQSGRFDDPLELDEVVSHAPLEELRREPIEVTHGSPGGRRC